ncbi:amidase signature domain-containing protein [Emericellopsis atlantica]|uniref:Amidase signature domain-containing protein n=1 Tax=Emericellopsis atlantica TaxID=2614577 RepID=A0A9P7ZPJ0_9HYPO|nr:amidase signature domain-containing protein [Emericellopsis atlantica]KAG9255909.1 amidase signature domain-containing protein [Emericellopsis atlantica]
MAPKDFIGYPVPQEGPRAEYEKAPENNPVLRGTALTVAANIIAYVPGVASLFWNNAGFGTLKDLPELDGMPYRFHPIVTPLGDSKMLPIDASLTESKNTLTSSSSSKYYTAADYHAMYKSGAITPLQVAETLIPLTKKGAYADAWADTHGKEHLALEAAKASTERYAAGKDLGVLDGVPIGVKDDLDIKGMVSHVGMKYRPDVKCFEPKDRTEWFLEKLAEAGAVFIGRNKMHELGMDTNGLNIAQGTPTNHFNNAYYPGASTSGGGSALGAGIIPIAIGSDAGGSIRLPSAFNSMYGLKTSHHRTGYYNLSTCVRGPLAASAADLTIAYRLMSQPNLDDPAQTHYGVSQLPKPGSKRVMGIYRDWWNAGDPEVVRLCEKAVDYFATQRGYEVIDISLPLMGEARVAHAMLCVAETYETTRRKTPDQPKTGWMGLVGTVNRLLMSVASVTRANDYLKANALRELMMRHLAWLWQQHPGMLIMTPTSPMIGWPRHPGDEGGLSDTNTTVKNMMYIFLANLTGTPAVQAPVGYAEPKQGTGKLPVGIQAMGEWGAEEQLLEFAREAQEYIEEASDGGRRRPETWFDVLGETKKAFKKDV